MHCKLTSFKKETILELLDIALGRIKPSTAEFDRKYNSFAYTATDIMSSDYELISEFFLGPKSTISGKKNIVESLLKELKRADNDSKLKSQNESNRTKLENEAKQNAMIHDKQQPSHNESAKIESNKIEQQANLKMGQIAKNENQTVKDSNRELNMDKNDSKINDLLEQKNLIKSNDSKTDNFILDKSPKTVLTEKKRIESQLDSKNTQKFEQTITNSESKKQHLNPNDNFNHKTDDNHLLDVGSSISVNDLHSKDKHFLNQGLIIRP